ncbi:autotransporter outer membrane beta-barrel domain-containing protein [Spongiivirga sp. MCCC 1A20706]|uniref:autotransporter outer membrane beta-barrel domain-containing protein n=1 Tax=Spongiivirga sp. MCCC 1A20706 TaxID=3160963 RepID=UPI003977C110
MISNNFLFRLILVFLLSILSFSLPAQSKDSLTSDTPFRKGRWLTGLDGVISSSTSEIAGVEGKTTSNQFGINISTGKFVKDRLLLGGAFQAQRTSGSGNINRATETLFIGPMGNYYLSNNSKGALFLQLSAGYVRYLDDTTVAQANSNVQFESEGNGFGAIVGVGYSYVINNRIAFDLAFNVNSFWINVDTETSDNMVLNETITVSDTLFSFGFNVLLDDFFF